jgi:hypothetical protein
MGNVVASEALRLESIQPQPQKLVQTYIASQAAVPADAYDDATAPVVDRHALDPIRSVLRTKTKGPNLYFKSPVDEKPLFGGNDKAAVHLVNFYNPDDYALGAVPAVFGGGNHASAWVLNQAVKPKSFPTLKRRYTYAYDAATNTWTRWWMELPPNGGDSVRHDVKLDLSVPNELHEVLSYIVGARSNAVGSIKLAAGPFWRSAGVKSTVNLKELEPDQTSPQNLTSLGFDHSGQFYFDNATRSDYWHDALVSIGAVQ